MVKSIIVLGGKKYYLFNIMHEKYVYDFKKDTLEDNPERGFRAVKVSSGSDKGKYAVYLTR